MADDIVVGGGICSFNEWRGWEEWVVAGIVVDRWAVMAKYICLSASSPFHLYLSLSFLYL